MTKTSVADVLRELAKGDKSRSETARLRDVIDEVEAALAAGVSRSAVLEALHGQGFTMTLKSFESALYRIRKQRGQGAAGAPAAPAPAPLRHDEKPPASPPAESAREGDKPKARITNPADVRKARKRDIDLESLEDGSDDQE
ncbi:hypothetical protein NZL82_18790 [Sphingomonas sanguinis]|uniref:hypothetical protein n=1 Tax=Sphingomonas sp. LC-1 TaxID=3110957 RepID=UPI0021BA51E6|nr:hypothetical protein [Sphingomonas sp. LC-1]MCT8003918.1 hypothetical protein [Sphingomonas sp. LC-1]